MFFHRRSQDNTLDYLILLSALTAAAIIVRLFTLTKPSLVLTCLSLSAAYVLWGLTHHKKAGHIDKKIMLEYLGIALLVNTLVIFLAL